MTLHLPAFRVETAPLPITETAAAELAEVLAADERILAAWPREDCTPPVLFVAARPEGAVPVENRYSDPPGFGAYVARVATEVCAAAGLPYAFTGREMSYSYPWWSPADNMIDAVARARQVLDEFPPEHRAPLASAIRSLEVATWDIEAAIDPPSAAARRVAMTEVVGE